MSPRSGRPLGARALGALAFAFWFALAGVVILGSFAGALWSLLRG